MIRALLIILLLGGCAAQAETAERFAGEGLDVLENTSRVAVNTCRQYLGRTARIGPLFEWIKTPEQRQAFTLLFSSTSPVLPESE